MKTLIEKSLAALQAHSTLEYVKDRDIYVTEDIRLIRNQGIYPAIGIKDGGINFQALSGDQDNDTLTLTLAAYVLLAKTGAGIMGDPSTSSKGVLDVAADIIAVLKDNDLGALVETALPVSQGASEILIDDRRFVMMCPVTMKYEQFD